MTSRTSIIIRCTVVVAVLVGLFTGYQKYLSPTRIALVNYADFQAARVIRANINHMIRVDTLTAEQI